MEALADLLGVHDKDDLLQLMQEMGMAKTYSSKEDEVIYLFDVDDITKIEIFIS